MSETITKRRGNPIVGFVASPELAESGESLSAIGRVAGVSRQRVAQIVGRTR